MRYLNRFEWDQGKCMWFIPYTPKGRNHPAAWMEEVSPAQGWQRTQFRNSQIKLFPLSGEILESMEDPYSTAALLSLGETLKVPGLKEEWRESIGDLHPPWHAGHLSVSVHVPLQGLQGLQACCAAEPQPAGGVQHRGHGSALLLLYPSIVTLSLYRFTEKNPWICLRKCWKLKLEFGDDFSPFPMHLGIKGIIII